MNAFDTIVPFLERNIPGEGTVIHVNDHVRIPVKKDAFKPLSSVAKTVVFVDGGNGDVLRSANVNVQFVRLAAVFYQGSNRVKREQKEFFVVTVARKRDLDLVFEARMFDVNGGIMGTSMIVDSLDPALRSGYHRVTPEVVGSHVRKLEEVKFAKEIVRELKQGDVLVRDGDLLLTGPHVSDELRALRLAGENLKVHILGLSKTSRLCADSGASATALISSIAPGGVWYYFVDGFVGFVKLHGRSKHVFRFDVFSHDRASLPDTLGALIPLSADPVFVGYPYGLVDVDKCARVSDHELRQLRLRFSLKAKGLFDSLEASVDAHDILNKI